MKNRFIWASALALAVIVSSQKETQAANGVIVMTTRTGSDALWREISGSPSYDGDDPRGPGALSPGDAAMASLLGDYGYVVRMVPEWLLRPDVFDPENPAIYDTTQYYDPSSGVTGIYFGGGHALGADAASNNLFSAVLVIVSGSGGSADMPPVNTNGIPIIMGEHSCLGDNKANCNMYMYSNKSSGNDASTVQGDKQYMTVLSPNHPIMQGIPLDAQNRVKIWRNPYPEEDAVHTPTGAKLNYRYSWTYVDISAGLSVPAPDTTIIGVQGDNANHAVFAVNPAGGMLADGTSSHGNYVQLFVNEHGSGDARRAFNALTDIGRVIFIRTCKWAMGETLTPYQPLGLIKVSQVGPTSIQLSWDGRADKNYKVLGTQNISGPADFSNWQTVDEDIHGANGTISVTYKMGNAKQYAFRRVTQVP